MELKTIRQQSYRIVRDWSARKAEYVYILYKFSVFEDGSRDYDRAWGGREWAEKNAEHFGIQIEDEPADLPRFYHLIP